MKKAGAVQAGLPSILHMFQHKELGSRTASSLPFEGELLGLTHWL